MIKGLIITHGNLGKELIEDAEKILEEKIDMDFQYFLGNKSVSSHKVSVDKWRNL